MYLIVGINKKNCGFQNNVPEYKTLQKILLKN